MLLIENDTTEIFWSYFDDIVDALNIKHCEISKEHSNLILNVIKTFEKHPSIRKIKELNSGCRFSFENVSLEDVKKVLRVKTGYCESFSTAVYRYRIYRYRYSN